MTHSDPSPPEVSALCFSSLSFGCSFCVWDSRLLNALKVGVQKAVKAHNMLLEGFLTVRPENSSESDVI